jgi:hypothetical protein
MNSARLSEVVNFCDKLLKTNSFKDYDEAVNGYNSKTIVAR